MVNQFIFAFIQYFTLVSAFGTSKAETDGGVLVLND